MTLLVAISPGELIDKMTILEIKAERIKDAGKLVYIKAELALLRKVFEENVCISQRLGDLTINLKRVNEALWDIEDHIRICEKEKDFGKRFIELARSVYKSNDLRAELKREINELLSSNIYEVKSYEDYS
jgi:hypothetical protein